MTETKLKAFRIKDRRMFTNVSVNPDKGTVRLRETRTVSRMERVVLLPAIGLTDRRGREVFLGDVLLVRDDDVYWTYVVGPLPALAQLVDTFVLSGLRPRKPGHVSFRPGELKADAETLGRMQVIGNLYENYQRFVPHHEYGCYGKGVNCPFWQRSDHGVVYCRLMQLGSLDNHKGSFEAALKVYGGEEALWKRAPLLIVWDQIKECGVNDGREEGE